MSSSMGSVDATADSVVAYLLEHRLLTERDLVREGLRVRSVGGRNRNFVAVTESGTGFFLKHAPPGEANRAYLAVEAEVYRRAQQDPGYLVLQPLLPPLRLYDETHRVLVLDFVSTARTVYEFDERHSTMGLCRISEPLGRSLGAYHNGLRIATEEQRDPVLPSTSPPWVLNLARPHPEGLREFSRAQAQVIRLLQQRADVRAVLDDLREGWFGSTIVHGDLKWANVLVEPDSAGQRAMGIKLVDWEMAAVGDPAWDVGSVLHSYLAHCVLAMDVDDDASPEAAAEAFTVALESVQPEQAMFWEVYARTAGLSGPDAARFLARVVQHCGARLLQSAYEWSRTEDRMPRSAAAILQLSMNILRQPEEAQRSVLALRAEHDA